ncbi:hypothetical protein OG426_43215 [Streptomyces canus]|uniref:hypothetical protein n=1 Tax=Streptomyces canus TaxID=58343 RepID=UPI00386CAE8F|nr:hypothetical protein OG426_43215 [Streptomyces canus]
MQISKAAVLLGDMAAGRVPISHECLDALPRTGWVDFLRDFLVVVGVLPERQLHLARLPPWLDRLLADRPAEQARIVRTYATWQVLRRLHASSATAPVSYARAHRARSCISRAADLLAWLEQRGQDLSTLRQTDLDQWLCEAPGGRNYIAPFLTWTRSRRLTGDVTVHRPPESEPTAGMDHDDRWALVNELLHTQHAAIELRVAGLFVLLFAQPLSRISTLTVGDVHLGDRRVEVRFGTDMIVLPDPLADLVRDMVGRRCHSSYPDQQRTWLFPGGAPGRPLTDLALGQRLRDLGMPRIRNARNSALMHLAAQLPSPILASLLGLHPSRAAAWGNLANRDWAAYAAHRAHRPDRRGSTDS